MTHYKLSKGELLEHLKRQVAFISRSCDAYDSGFADEACRIAVAIRILIHDTGSSNSVLAQLEEKMKITYWDSADPIFSGNLISSPTLVYMRMHSENGNMISKYMPKLHDGPPGLNGGWKSFDPWWEQIVVIDKRREKFTRKDLILNLANKDGGAHVDKSLSQDFADLLKFNSIGFEKNINGISNSFDNNVVYASVRQIGFEILESIAKHKLC